MVQKYQSPVRVYKYPFELVMAAYVRRFPTCDMIPVFVGSDTVNEYNSDDGAIHVIERRCRLNIDAPYLLKKIVGVDLVYFIQKNTLNRRNRILEIEAYNESFDTRITINEYCRYFVHPENSDWTCFEQSASLEIKSFYGFEGVVEKIAVKQYSANIAKGKEIIEHFIGKLKEEGITHVPVWEEKQPSAGENSDDKLNGHCNAVEENKESKDTSTPIDIKRKESLEIASGSSLKSNLTRQHSGSGDRDKTGSGSIPLIRCDSFAEDTEKFRLDADYIQRCLGELSPLEESQLVQLQIWVSQLQKGHPPSARTVLRFLRAGDFNIEKAREMLSHSLHWRKKYQMDKILSEYKAPQVIKDYFPGGWHHNDKEGRPLFILRLGMMDVKGLIKSVGEEGMLRMTLHICEEGLRLTKEATAQRGRPVSTWTLLLDLEGLNMRHLWRPGISALLRIIETVEANYPETMGKMLIIRAPRVFPVLWTVVRTFIDERTCSKFLFYSGNDYREPGGLPDYIDEEFIPDFLDGPCKVNIPEGGLVPKTCYLPEEQFENLTISEESIYKSVSMSKGQVHEVILHNEDLGSVITWDFDVLCHDVCFSVFMTKHEITSNQGMVTGTLQTINGQIPVSENCDHKTVIDKSWKEGTDFFQVENPTTCHDGESIQGSHVTNQKGYFILQWKYLDSNPLTGHHLRESFSSPKSKVMYYLEVLKSADYRGSMSSLQSQHSGFSSLSSKTNLSVVESSSNQSGTSKTVSSCPSR